MPDLLPGHVFRMRIDFGSSRPDARRLFLVATFVFLSGWCGLRLVYATPMGEVADEPSHIARAAGLLDFDILGHRAVIGHTQVSGLFVNDGVLRASLSEFRPLRHRLLTPADRARAAAIPWSSGPPVYFVASGSIEYLPVLYMPGALGIAAGRVIGLHPLGALYLGRVFMLLGYLTLGALALFIARFGAVLLFALLSLPMTVSLAASFNQDGMIIATCALAGALLTHDPATRPAFRWLAAGLLAIMVCSKPPYGLLVFCAAMPVMERGLWRRLVAAGLCGIPATIWLAVMMRTSFVPRDVTPYPAGPLWPGRPGQMFDSIDVMANLHVLLAHPGQIVAIPVRYVETYYNALVAEFIGDLGWLNVPIPSWLREAWLVALLLACCAVPLMQRRGARRWTLPDGGFTLSLVLASVIAVCLSLYVSWTPVGATMLMGVQGRYFLPLVPFVPLLVPRPSPRWRASALPAPLSAALGFVLVAPVLILSAVDIAVLPAVIRHRFW